jgi:ribokinase
MDLVVRVPRHPRVGETVLGSSFATYLGGKGYNQAVAAARLGASVAMVGAVGDDDFGRAFAAALEDEGIDASGVRESAAGTGVAVPVVDENGANSIVMVPRANGSVTEADVDAAREAFGRAAVVVLQLEVPLDTCIAAGRRAQATGATLIWNLAPFAPVPEEALAQADVVVVNEAEAGGLLGAAPAGPKGGLQAAHAIRLLGAPAAVVTLGPEGAAYEDEHGAGYVPAYPVKTVDTVGAGDAFCGALAWALIADEPLSRAVEYGNAAGALSTLTHGGGPSMPRLDELRAFMAGGGR